MLLKISQYDAAKIIELYLNHHKVKLHSEVEINNDEANFTTFDVEVDFSLIHGQGIIK